MYALYYYPDNASMAPHMALEEIGARFELRLVDRDRQAHKSPEYLRLNPNGLIPVLIDGELILFESAAICLHLADRHPEAALAPPLATTERAEFYKWLIHLTNTLQPEILIYAYPERRAEDAACAAQAKRQAERRVGDILDRIETALVERGPYLLGDRFSIADGYLFMLALWTRRMANPAHERPAIRRLLDHVGDRPAVRRVIATEKLGTPLF